MKENDIIFVSHPDIFYSKFYLFAINKIEKGKIYFNRKTYTRIDDQFELSMHVRLVSRYDPDENNDYKYYIIIGNGTPDKELWTSILKKIYADNEKTESYTDGLFTNPPNCKWIKESQFHKECFSNHSAWQKKYSLNL